MNKIIKSVMFAIALIVGYSLVTIGFASRKVVDFGYAAVSKVNDVVFYAFVKMGAIQFVTLQSNILTLHDWAKRLDPDGKTPEIVELLAFEDQPR